jgi:uncharacterized protein YajQ (UPF0234 family)
MTKRISKEFVKDSKVRVQHRFITKQNQAGKRNRDDMQTVGVTLLDSPLPGNVYTI